jgi:hypothetical protein
MSAAPRVGDNVRVYENHGSRRVNGVVVPPPIGRIVRVHSALLLDIDVDLFGNGRVITLIGVFRRQGSGNGWEPMTT